MLLSSPQNKNGVLAGIPCNLVRLQYAEKIEHVLFPFCRVPAGGLLVHAACC